jgi:hypothetical protein
MGSRWTTRPLRRVQVEFEILESPDLPFTSKILQRGKGNLVRA